VFCRFSVMLRSSLLRVLATSILAGESTVEHIIVRVNQTLGRSWRWVPPLSQRYVKAFAGRTRPRRRDVVQFLRHDPGFLRAWSKHFHELWVEQWLTEQQRMQPVTAAETWAIPIIESPGALANWLGLRTVELQWFAPQGTRVQEQSPQVEALPLPDIGEAIRQHSTD
jgi:RNA-directed DNA polymerase